MKAKASLPIVLSGVYTAFVVTGAVSRDEWDAIVANPNLYIKKRQLPPIPADGPGTQLRELYKSLGIETKTGCGGCEAKLRQMNVWRVAGCRNNRNTIIGWMRDGQANYGTAEKLLAGWKALTTGLALKLDVRDPFPGLVDEAIGRAEKMELASAAAETPSAAL